MDAQGPGRDEEIDPADQWVFDPNTGDYQLRLEPTGERPTPPAQRTASTPPPKRSAAPEEPPDGDRPDVPRQRSRRAGKRSAAPAASGGRRRQKPKKSGKKKALYWVAGATAFVLVGGSAAAYIVYQELNGNITKVDVGEENAAVTDGPVNILVIGTDARTGKGNQGYGDNGSVGHADTTILYHVSADRTNATAISIPRDVITDIPECTVKLENGEEKTIPGSQQARFNTSLGQSDRDPGCTWQTVEKLTGLEISHFLMADFNAVKTLSTAVGGVEVCLTRPIKDPKSKLDLPAGVSLVEGEDALAFVRTRHSVGFESDLDRIKLQQQFLSSMLRKVKSDKILTSPSKLWKLSSAATKALTVDTGIGSPKKLADMARDIGQVDLKNVTFTTLPVVDNTDGATVSVNESVADPLLAMVREDVSLTEVKKKEKAAKDEQKALLEGPKAPPAEVRVDVLNGGGPFGAAQDTVDWLQNTQGVPLSTNGGNATGEKLKKSVLEFAPNQADQARQLADLMGLPASALKQSTEDADPKTPMTLTLGADFKGAGTPIAAPSKAPKEISRIEADDKKQCVK
ncbi:LCP family protein [Streptomyces sp. TP-A0874]|uniref:LCP family protein n=1 Tax=Streptomyces sp. TP-A0874 TaxID=549819 RepID=UPI00085391BB|nr:LCP family protein [Streptomyces sp. TP-A0874]